MRLQWTISLFHAHPRPRSPVSTVWSSAAKKSAEIHIFKLRHSVVSEVQLGSAYCKLVHFCEIKITTKYFDEFLLSSVGIMTCIRKVVHTPEKRVNHFFPAKRPCFRGSQGGLEKYWPYLQQQISQHYVSALQGFHIWILSPPLQSIHGTKAFFALCKMPYPYPPLVFAPVRERKLMPWKIAWLWAVTF